MTHIGEKELLKIVIYLLFVLTCHCKKKKEESKLTNGGQEMDANVFCKNISRLIRMEKTDEIYVVDTVVNNSVLLQCKYCEEKDNGFPKTWSKQRHIFSGNITEIETDMDNNQSASSIYVTKDHSLVIKHLQEKDLGLYFCKAPFVDTPDQSFNYLIDLISKPEPDVRGSALDLKNYTQTYLIPINELISSKTFSVNKIIVQMKVYSDWSAWSECDSCFRKEGIRFRKGMCRVKPVCSDSKQCIEERDRFKNFVFNDKQNTEKAMIVPREVLDEEQVEENILEFGVALSCTSLLLKTVTPDLYSLTSIIPNFIQSEKCKGVCKTTDQKSGPRYRKSIILAKGAHLTLVCPDSTIDSDIRWEHNKLRLHPNEGADYIPGTIEPRQYVDSFNTLYLIEVTEKEAGNYTCFVNGVRMQEVKILVLARSGFFTKEFFRHLKYLGFVFLLCFAIYVAGVIVVCVKSFSEMKLIPVIPKVFSDNELLLNKSKKKRKKRKKDDVSTESPTSSEFSEDT